MNRCLKILTALLPTVCTTLVAATAMTLPLAAQAQQGMRPFPPDAFRGVLVVTAAPQVLLNGQSRLLAPGAQIRNERNLLVLSGMLAGEPLTVNYQRDAQGLIQQVWILTPQEAAEKRPVERPASAS